MYPWRLTSSGEPSEEKEKEDKSCAEGMVLSCFPLRTKLLLGIKPFQLFLAVFGWVLSSRTGSLDQPWTFL